ncbi:MAG: LysM peptidoglycan-binding domain-containing protein [Ignavibacteriae bacterium]|nr:LysM peptidoglycan-binding domain-containing protein [Ignavibacteriota bacterium]
MNRLSLLLIGSLLLSCSTQDAIRSDASTASEVDSSEKNDSASAVTSSSTRDSASQLSELTHAQLRGDTLIVKSDSLDAESDSTADQEIYISEKLEDARQFYLAALTAQEVGDSTLCAQEFENAIQALNELSYLPGIEANTEFTDLSQNVIDDYEKYIATIDDLSPEASVFALREQLNQIIEKVDISDAVAIPEEVITETAVALPVNDYVERNIAFFMGERGRQHFTKWIQLSGKYFPMMKRIFREENVPEELIYLSMIESGLRPDARSWAKAVGLWQFMVGTGRLYGLRGNWWFDERRDFEKATRAAARHMKDLHSEFGDWHVVLAAYNSGAGNVYKAIRRSGSTDYWTMRPFLPRQTRNYVPEYIAVVRMFRNPEKYGFVGIEPLDSLAYDVVTIDDCVDLSVLAKCAQTDVKTLKELNPELLQWCTPPGVTGYPFRIPQGTSELFAENYAKVPEDEKRDWSFHQVKKGETLSTIARRYGLTASLLQDANNIKNSRKLAIGTRLAIPLPKGIMPNGTKVPFGEGGKVTGMNFDAMKAYVAKRETSRKTRTTKKAPPPAGKEQLVYRVKRGDTIGHIAEWYNVRASDIRNWNGIAYGSVLSINRELVIWVDKSKAEAFRKVNQMSFDEKQTFSMEKPVQASIFGGITGSNGTDSNAEWTRYKVRSGDTLEKIAEQHGVSISELRRWNSLRSSRIYAGQELAIYSVPDERVKLIETPGTNGSIASTSEPLTPAAANEVFYHQVKRGDTLWEIAKKYGVTVQDLKELNDIADGLKAGDRIAIPKK